MNTFKTMGATTLVWAILTTPIHPGLAGLMFFVSLCCFGLGVVTDFEIPDFDLSPSRSWTSWGRRDGEADVLLDERSRAPARQQPRDGPSARSDEVTQDVENQ